MEQANLVSSEQKVNQFRNRVIRSGVAMLATFSYVGLSQGHASAEDYVINTQLGPAFCKDGETNFDYAMQNVNNPSTIPVNLDINNEVAVTENVPTGQTILGTYATSLTAGQPYKITFSSEGQPAGQQYTGTGLECAPAIKIATPIEPLANDLDGTANDTITIRESDGVSYNVNDEPKAPGTYNVNGTVVVDAYPNVGYRFTVEPPTTWVYNFTDLNDKNSTPSADISDFPTPTVVFDSKHPKRVVHKKFRKKCAKVDKARNDIYTSINKKEKKFLKKKCKIKYVNVSGSTKRTKVYQGVPYDWGVKPLDTGGTKKMFKGHYQKMYADEVQVDRPTITENIFTTDGKLKAMNPVGGTYYYPSVYYKKNGKPELVSNRVDQPKVAKKRKGEVVDTLIETQYCNNSDENRSVTTGLKTHSKKPQIIVEKTFNLNPGECRKAIVSDSDGQPQTTEESNGFTANPEQYFVHINPDQAGSLKYRGKKKAIYYYRINSDSTDLRYYQRSTLVGSRDKRWGKENPDQKPINGSQNINRGW